MYSKTTEQNNLKISINSHFSKSDLKKESMIFYLRLSRCIHCDCLVYFICLLNLFDFNVCYECLSLVTRLFTQTSIYDNHIVYTNTNYDVMMALGMGRPLPRNFQKTNKLGEFPGACCQNIG